VLAGIGFRWQGSSIWIDPKGQALSVLGRYLQELGIDVFVLNPFNILPEFIGRFRQACFNPMAVLDPGSRNFGADCESLADAIVYEEARGADGNHWSLSSKDLFGGGIGALARHGSPEDRNLAAVRELVCSPNFFGFCREAVKTHDEFIRQKLGRFAQTGAEDSKEIASIISTAITQSSFIGNKAIAENLCLSDFRFRQLKERPTAVFLVLPARYLGTCSKWFRLIVAAAMDELLHEERGVPVLMVLDEFAQLGRLKVIENAMALARGYGVQLLPVLQDLNQLKVYAETWETFLANAGCRIFFAPHDKFTSEYLSAMCGDAEVRGISKSLGEKADGQLSVSLTYAQHGRRYLMPHEIRELPGNEMLVFGEGIRGVIRTGRRPYYRSPEFDGMYAPDPYHSAVSTKDVA
jgi:type IV secretion system protein VirD4